MGGIKVPTDQNTERTKIVNDRDSFMCNVGVVRSLKTFWVPRLTFLERSWKCFGFSNRFFFLNLFKTSLPGDETVVLVFDECFSVSVIVDPRKTEKHSVVRNNCPSQRFGHCLLHICTLAVFSAKAGTIIESNVRGNQISRTFGVLARRRLDSCLADFQARTLNQLDSLIKSRQPMRAELP